MTLERVQVRGPELTEWREPGIHLPEWFRFQPVQATLCIHRRLHEAGLAQYAQVLRDGRLRHAKVTFDFADRLLRRDQQAQYRAAVRLCDDFEDRFHTLDIRQGVYACQGIYADSECRCSIEPARCDMRRRFTGSVLIAAAI